MPSTVLGVENNLKKFTVLSQQNTNTIAKSTIYYDRIKHRILRLNNRGESNTL